MLGDSGRKWGQGAASLGCCICPMGWREPAAAEEGWSCRDSRVMLSCRSRVLPMGPRASGGAAESVMLCAPMERRALQETSCSSPVV